MIYKEALEKFNTDDVVCVLIEMKDGPKALTEHNFCGGSCSCCQGCDCDDDLIVIRVVNVETMEVFYDRGEQ